MKSLRIARDKVERKDVLRLKNTNRGATTGEDIMMRLARHMKIDRETARKVMQSFKGAIMKGTAEGEVQIKGFGRFYTREMKEQIPSLAGNRSPCYRPKMKVIHFRPAFTWKKELLGD